MYFDVLIMSHKLSLIFILYTLVGILRAEVPKDPGLIQNVKPKTKAAKGLICYQCHSITGDFTPLCDKSVFKLSTPAEKMNMSLQCPHYQGAYCFLKVIVRHKKHVETLRGCSGPKDKNGHLMKVGCMTIVKKNSTESLCLCDTKFCNKEISYHSLIPVKNALILALTITLLNTKMYSY